MRDDRRGYGDRPEGRGPGPRRIDRRNEAPRVELEIPEDITGLEVDRAVKAELRTLSKDNAKGVGQHLIMVARLLDEDIDLARAHADAAVRRAGRVPSVREARGMVAYHEGDWHLALQEFRTARRLSGSQHLLPYMIDCERALGRTEKALELATSEEVETLPAAERIEVAIVTSGIRRDLGQLEAAVAGLERRHLVPGRPEPWAPRLYYAYAEALLELGRTEEARRWFQAAAEADVDLQTDAWERLDELDGTVLVDLMDDPEDDETASHPDDAVGDERDAAPHAHGVARGDEDGPRGDVPRGEADSTRTENDAPADEADTVRAGEGASPVEAGTAHAEAPSDDGRTEGEAGTLRTTSVDEAAASEDADRTSGVADSEVAGSRETAGTAGSVDTDAPATDAPATDAPAIGEPAEAGAEAGAEADEDGPRTEEDGR
ncbi:tetratricopeptide repeat protein [Mobilicoccus pelagius]|uniref:tetratricopeptide repeat protein n=1 Tax=Mobilicoccus pelagius TaxID=746032 RepID=UPI0002F2A37A|nr:tetratricopeptide repeat protein [Mobilicoccus pelagius]